MGIHLSTLSKIKRKEFLILLLCLLIGFALRFYTFDQKSLWIDEIHTYNDSSDDLKGQIKFYKENPTYLHPPFFFILTHLFYPFTKPERDLRILPLIFGTLSIPMIYLLARQFSPPIALPCTISLTFMAYHVYLSQDGRSYSMLMFLGMVGLYFLMKSVITFKKRYLVLVAFFFSVLFYISYSSILFIVLSQILWLYKPREGFEKPGFSSFAILNSLILLLCMPWVIFIGMNYKGQQMLDPLSTQDLGSFLSILGGIFNDWVPRLPLTIVSIILFILFPIFSKYRRNALLLLAVLFLPVGGSFVLCKLFNIRHFLNSRYFINFLPLFFIAIYLSIYEIENKFVGLKKFMRLRLMFVVLLIASNLLILPFYYRSEKQDFRGLVAYLKDQLRDRDKIYVRSIAYIPGILHYFGVKPRVRHYDIPFSWIDSGKTLAVRIPLVYDEITFAIYHSDVCCTEYVADGSRLWIVVGKPDMKQLKESSPSVLKGVFDGSVSNFRRFPGDASMYLFLWDPKSPHEKGIDLPIE
jgi:uncharacterized membrane protein